MFPEIEQTPQRIKLAALRARCRTSTEKYSILLARSTDPTLRKGYQALLASYATMAHSLEIVAQFRSWLADARFLDPDRPRYSRPG
jgi:hypothetical protein